MTREFDADYWERHWEPHTATNHAPNPCLIREISGLVPGTALDAGCGEGAEAIWLAAHGWHVTAADIAPGVLARAAARAAGTPASELVQWVEADLTAWQPDTEFDLVTTSYAHSAMPQLAFYQRISAWVAPGGTLLIVGHLPTPEPAGHGHHPPATASVTAADITAALDSARWEIVTADEHSRALAGPAGQAVPLHDAVVRATRRLSPEADG